LSPLDSLIVPQDCKKIRSAIQFAIAQDQPFELEYRIRHKDGDLRHFVERGRPIKSSQNNPLYIDGFIFDITERKQNEERLTRAAHQMEALYTTSLVINSNTNLSSLLSYVVKQAVLMSGTSTGCLYLINPDQQILEMVASYNLPPSLTGIKLQLGEGLSGKVAQSGETTFVTNYSDWEGHAIPFEQVTTRRVLAVPLKVKEHIIGVINVADKKNTNPFSMEEIRLLALFADQAAIAVENAQLYARLEHQAIVDELTGLYNRRALMELGKREVDRARRFQRPLCALFIDIDHFKQFNDQYGHTAGDWLLRSVAQNLRNGIRDIDLASRFGGEEFIILLTETSIDAASLVAERLRKQVETTKISLPQGKLGATVSIGVAQLDQKIFRLEDLISCADQAMYQAKQAGRNRVTTWHKA
ncbi:MAG: diguanylate cyclase, partial [Anaerolineales bacterium]